jgi:hypothetical protein
MEATSLMETGVMAAASQASMVMTTDMVDAHGCAGRLTGSTYWWDRYYACSNY